MINFLKGLFLRLKIERLVNEVCKNTDDDELRLLNLEMMGIEEMYIQYYNLVLFTPYYSRSAKREVLNELKELTEVMNQFRFNKHCVA